MNASRCLSSVTRWLSAGNVCFLPHSELCRCCRTGPTWLSEWPTTMWNPVGLYSEWGGHRRALLLLSLKPVVSLVTSCNSRKTRKRKHMKWMSAQLTGLVGTYICMCVTSVHNILFLYSSRCMSRSQSSLVQGQRWWLLVSASVGLT